MANTRPPCTATHQESFHRTLPLVSGTERERVGLTFSDIVNIQGLLGHILMSAPYEFNNERTGERRLDQGVTTGQLSARIHVKSKAGSWCHVWPLEDLTCHFSYRSTNEKGAETHSHTFYKNPSFLCCPPWLAYVPVHASVYMCLQTIGKVWGYGCLKIYLSPLICWSSVAKWLCVWR